MDERGGGFRFERVVRRFEYLEYDNLQLLIVGKKIYQVKPVDSEFCNSETRSDLWWNGAEAPREGPEDETANK